MRRLAALALVLAACGDADVSSATAPAARDRPRRDAPPRAASPDAAGPASESVRSPLLADGDLGGWTPAPEDCEAARKLGATEEDLDEAVAALSPSDRSRILRAGLRLRDLRAARRAAGRVDPAWLDLWEQRRCAAILVDSAAFDPAQQAGGQDFAADLWRLPEIGAPSDAALVLDRLAAARNPDVLRHGDIVACVGGLLRSEHVPRIVALCRSDDEHVREIGYRLLVVLLPRADGHRELIASLLPDGVDDRIGPIRLADLPDAAVLSDWRARGAPDVPTAPTRDEVMRVLLRPDVQVVATIEEMFAEPALFGRIRSASCAPGPWPAAHAEPWCAGLADALVASDLSWQRLAAAALAVPGCRTRAVAEAIVARLPGDPGADEILQREAQLLSFLETAAPEALLWKLRGWAAAGHAMYAPRCLLLLRDVASAPQIVAWCERRRATNWADVSWRELGGLRTPAVREFLVRHVEEAEGWSPAVSTAYEAIAVQDGLSEDVREWPWPGGDDARASVAKLVLARRPVEAFVATLASSPDAVVTGEGAVHDARVRAHLESIRDRRELGLYVRATSELARMGDPAARAERDAALREGRVAWLAEIPRDLGTPDSPLGAVETCTAALESWELGSTVGTDFFAAWFGWNPCEDDTKGLTAAGRFRAWWARHEGRFVLSRTADEYVPAPR